MATIFCVLYKTSNIIPVNLLDLTLSLIYTAVVSFHGELPVSVFFYLNLSVLQGHSTFFCFFFLSLPEKEIKRMENVVPSFTSLIMSVIDLSLF